MAYMYDFAICFSRKEVISALFYDSFTELRRSQSVELVPGRHRGPVMTLASYSIGPGIKSWPGDRLSPLRYFMNFLSLSNADVEL
jgi:hypothetical protein